MPFFSAAAAKARKLEPVPMKEKIKKAAAAEKKGISSDVHGLKAFYYLGGLTEGTETILFFVIICMYPEYFPLLAVVLGSICWITVLGRFGSAFTLLR
jgi:hypothetical protein